MTRQSLKPAAKPIAGHQLPGTSAWTQAAGAWQSLTTKLQYCGSNVTVVSSGSVVVLGSTSGQLRASLPSILFKLFLQRDAHACSCQSATTATCCREMAHWVAEMPCSDAMHGCSTFRAGHACTSNLLLQVKACHHPRPPRFIQSTGGAQLGRRKAASKAADSATQPHGGLLTYSSRMTKSGVMPLSEELSRSRLLL